MDYRQTTRKQIHQRILLESSASGPVLIPIADISLGGMCIRAFPQSLKLRSRVTLSFALPLLGERHGFRLNATVVHLADNGAGLMFDVIAPRVMRALSDALFEAGASASMHDTHDVAMRA